MKKVAYLRMKLIMNLSLESVSFFPFKLIFASTTRVILRSRVLNVVYDLMKDILRSTAPGSKQDDFTKTVSL